MFLQHHYQNAYITRDLDQGLADFKSQYGFDRFKQIEVTQQMTVRGKRGEATVKLALGWIGDLQYELIQPVSGLVDVYTDDLRGKYPLEFHHVCMRVEDNWSEFRAGLDRDKRPVVMEGGTPGHLQFVYVDARDTLGHYLEYCWMTPERWTAMRAL
jgi:hypothetical protein